MHRWIDLRSLFAAITLTTLIPHDSSVSAEPNGGQLATNHEVAIEASPPPIPQPDEAEGDSAPVDAKLQGDDGDEPTDSAFATDQERPLIDADDQTAHDATRAMTAGADGLRADAERQSIGSTDHQETERRDGPLGFLPSSDHDMIQVVGAMAIVITLLLIFRFVMVRASGALAGSRPSGVLEILVRYPVARGQHLALIKLGRRILLVHQSGTAMTTLSEVSDSDEVAALLSRVEAGASGRDAARFRSLLTQYQKEQETIVARAGTQRSAVPDTPRDSRGEIVDLTRSQMGGLRTLFGGKS